MMLRRKDRKNRECKNARIPYLPKVSGLLPVVIIRLLFLRVSWHGGIWILTRTFCHSVLSHQDLI